MEKLNKELLEVCLQEKRDRAAVLIERGADVNAKNEDGNTALLLACGYGIHRDEARTEMVELLIEKGADIEAKDRNGRTPLMIACQQGYTNVAKLLIEKGADIEARKGNGETALMVACMYGRADVAQMLIEKGADVNAKNEDGETALDYATNEGMRKRLKEASEKTEAPHLTQTLSGLEEKDNRESDSSYTLSGEYARGNDISVSVANRALRNGR